MKLDRDKWQTDFEKQLDISEKKQIAIVKRFYKSEYNKGIESFIADGQTNFQNLFDNKPLLKIYSDLYTQIGIRFANWYAKTFENYLTKKIDTTNLDDIWAAKFAALGVSVGSQRVTLVSGTAKQTLIRITQRLMSDPEFMTLGAIEKGRILRNQFNRYSQFQAERLVRTEATAAANFATSAAATTIFPGDQLQKEWIAASDEKTRPTHRTADGQIVDQNAAFTVGGFSMMFPGDPSAPAKEVINCRCSIAHIPKEGAQTIGQITDINFGLSSGQNIGFNQNNILTRAEIIRNFENKIRNQKFESAGLFDKKGSLIFKKNGAAQSVKFSDDELQQMIGKYLTHNHPLDQSFSPEDIYVLATSGLFEIRAVTETRTFVMTCNKRFTNKREFTQLKSTITRITNKTLKRLRKSFRNGEITEQQYYYNGWNEVWNEFSKSKYKDNFKYNVQ